MHFVIMGCGRVGSTLAIDLAGRGHSVAIIDQDPYAFRKLPDSFNGQQVTGVGFDRDVLRQAGIEEANGFAAASSGDNSNIIAARVVRDTFGIANVVTRIYDSSRASIYQRLGIAAVAPVQWTSDQMLRSLIPLGPHVNYLDAATGVSLVTVDLHDAWYGASVADIENATNAKVAYLNRHDAPILPEAGTVIQDDDVVHLIVKTDRAYAVQRILNHAPDRDAS